MLLPLFLFLILLKILLYRCRLMYDPYTKIVFDYMGGMEDIRKAKVCMNYIVVKVPKLVIYLKSLHSSSPQNFICRCAL